MSGYLGARTQIADTGAYNREQADDLFPSKESVVAFSSTGTNTTMVKPPVYGIRVLEYTAATGTITLPDMSAQPGGGRFRIMKRNTTQGSVVIEPGFGEQDGMLVPNPGVWGNVQLKLNADGDFWELQWTGSRFVLTDGHESGSDGNGEYLKKSSGRLLCELLDFNMLYSSTTVLSYTWGFPVSFVGGLPVVIQTLKGTLPASFGNTVPRTQNTASASVRLDLVSEGIFTTSNSAGGTATATGYWYE